MTTVTTPEVQTTQVYQLFIKASPERIWEAITKPELVKLYYHNCSLESEVRAGGRWRAWSPDHTKVWVDAEILEFDPPRRLAHGWRSLYNDELADEPESRVTWEIEPQEGGYCLLSVTHDQLDGSPKTAESVSGPGWMMVLSGLKTLLETGDVLDPDRA